VKYHRYDSECIDADITVEIVEEDSYAVIDEGVVRVEPGIRIKRDGQLTNEPITESVFTRGSGCTSLKRERARFREWLKQVIAEHTVEKPLQEWVMENFPHEWEELKRDPIGWFLRQSERWHVGDDEVKFLTLIAVKSAFYEGLPKVGVLVLGSAGAGKSSAVKSILNMFTLKEGRSVVLWVSNLTKKALGNLAFTDGGKLLKNRCLFIIEAIDVETLKELSMLMTEGKLANLTAKVGEDVGGFYGTVEYPPSVVSTAVNIDYNNDQVTQIMSRFLTIAVDLESRDVDAIYEKIAERGDVVFEYDPKVKYLATAWLYYTPNRVTLPKEIAMRFKDVITEYNPYAFRVYEQGLKIIRIFASLLGKEVVDEEVYELFTRKLMRYFIVSAVGLNSVELKALQATTTEWEETKIIAMRLKVDTATAKAWLYNLARKGLVDLEKEGNRNKWRRNEFGQKVIELIVNGYKPGNDEPKHSADDDDDEKSYMTVYANHLRGRILSLKELYEFMGDEADALIRWAERRNIVTRIVKDGDTYLEFR
jgi:hypothetical protein